MTAITNANRKQRQLYPVVKATRETVCGLFRLRRLALAASASRCIGRAPFAHLAHKHESRFKAVVDFQFVENIGQVRLDGFFADKDSLPDLFVGKTFGD